MRLTNEQYRQMLREHPNLAPKADNKVICALQDSKPKRNEKAALDKAVCRETKSLPRSKVVFTLFRVRSLDPDNAAGSCKDLLDGVRHAGLLLGDEAWRIEFSVLQEKVNHFDEERTIIEITL